MIEIRKSSLIDAQFIDCSQISGADPFTEASFCFTLLDGEERLAVLGGTIQVEGCYRLFLLLPIGSKAKPLMYTKAAKSILAQASKISSEIRRIECTVRDDFQSGKDWANVLGFVEEGLLHDYDPKDSQDHLIYYLPKEIWNKGIN